MADTLAFDILARDKASGSFRSAASASAELARKLDITAISSRAASDALGKQKRASDLTAAQSAALARVLRLTGNEEDRLAAKALVASAAVKNLDESMKKTSGSAKTASGGLTLFGKAMLALNVATGIGEPALASLTVITAGLASGFTAAGAGLAAFGAVAKSDYTTASTAANAVQTAQVTYNAAIAHGTKQATAYKTEQIAIAKAYAQLSPAQIRLSKEIGGAKDAWQSFVQANTGGVAKVMTRGIGLLPKVFASLQPFLGPTEKALSGLIGQLGRGLSSAGFKSWIDAFAKASGPNITNIGQSIGHIVVGLAGMLKAFLPFATQMTHGLDDITARFAKWGTTLSSHSGFRSLTQMFKADGPLVLQNLKSLGSLLKSVISDMAGLSGIGNSRQLLQLATPFLALAASLAKSQPWLVRAVLYTLAFRSGVGSLVTTAGKFTSVFGDAWKAVVKFAGATAGAEVATEGMTVAQTIAAAATRAWGLAMAALPWVALAAAVIAVAAVVIKYHRQIWAFVKRVWNDVLGAISGVWHWVQRNWPLLLGILTGPIGMAVVQIVKHWKTIQDGIRTVVGWIRGAWKNAITWLVQAGKDVITGFWNGLVSVWHKVTGWFSGIAGWISRHKGPLSLDSQLLYAHGKAIMDGFRRGLQAGFGPVRGFVAGAGGSVAALMRKMAAARGWTGAQWQSLYNVEMREAGFNLTARNPGSGAYGLAQFINGPSEYARWGGSVTTAAGQIMAMLNYIASRYGSPVNAWRHEMSYGWYDRGGWLPPGVSLAVNRTGRPERVIGPGGGGGNTYNLNVSVPPGGEREAGRQIVAAIRKFEQGSGHGWRK